MSLARLLDYNFPVLLSFEIPLYICLENAILEIGEMVTELSIAKHSTNYTTVELINKGNDGLGSDIIATFNTDINDVDSIALTAFIPTTLFINQQVTKGDVVAVKKTDNSGAINFGFSSFVINERRF
jgi:hypothetical protein